MQKEPTAFAAFVGLDWADRKHDVVLHVPSAAKRERGVLEHKPAAIDGKRDPSRERAAACGRRAADRDGSADRRRGAELVEEGARRRAGDGAELGDQVRLVVVASGGRDGCPAGAFVFARGA